MDKEDIIKFAKCVAMGPPKPIYVYGEQYVWESVAEVKTRDGRPLRVHYYTGTPYDRTFTHLRIYCSDRFIHGEYVKSPF